MSQYVAINPDDYTAPGKPPGSDASSPRWARLLIEAGLRVKWVDVRRSDILDQLRDCRGFMWRWAHFSGMGRVARRLLPVIERELKIPVYPDQNTCWHYDDKIAQCYLLRALDVPMPRTWVWYDREQARAWAQEIKYPLVLKLASGAGSMNVKLIRSVPDAHLWIERLFAHQVHNLEEEPFRLLGFGRSFRHAASTIVRRRPTLLWDTGYEPQSGYVLFQEFLPNNGWDTRVTVIGNRAFAFRRFNRPGDFRASGSGLIDHNPDSIDQRFVRLAFTVTKRLRSQSCAIDGLYRGSERVVGEVSYTYVSSAVHDCPGHWILSGDAETGKLDWVAGHMWPEEAQAADFVARIRDRYDIY